LGDSVLQLVSSAYVYNYFPEHEEGELTLLRSALVNNNMLAQIAVELGMNEYIRYISSEELDYEGRAGNGMLADCFEAFLGALFLDQGMEVVRAFSKVCIFPKLEAAILEKGWLDPKTRFYQCVQSFIKKEAPYYSRTPYYKVLRETGPAHMKEFTVGLLIGDKLISQGKGNSVQNAERAAAEKALQVYDFE